MGAWKNFLEHLFSTNNNGKGTDAITISIPADIYYLELALYTASSLIGNAISRSEIKCFEDGKSVKNSDYFLSKVYRKLTEVYMYFKYIHICIS